jgi:hypothetical protein
MKKIKLLVFFLICFCFAKAQNPSGVPQLFGGKWYQFKQFVEVDSAIMVGSKDTSWNPIKPSIVFWQNSGIDTALWLYNGKKWAKVGTGGGGGIVIDTALLVSRSFRSTSQINDTTLSINRPDGTFDIIRISAQSIGNNYVQYLSRLTYALMIADGTPSVTTIYSVANDENKSYIRSTYIWKPDGNREWIASTPDN